METPKNSNIWKSFDFGPQPRKTNTESKNTNGNLEKHLVSLTNGMQFHRKMENFNFEVELAPVQICDLAIHPKKLQELQDCLLEILSKKTLNHPQILLLNGPSGSGKFTALKVICNDFGVRLEEWINPVDQAFEVTYENQISKFVDFLVGSKWCSLFEKDNNHITVVKDFPNAIIKQPEQFRGVLEECWYKTTAPFVFICTQVNNNHVNLLKNLFPEDIIQDFRIRQVDFNACAPTLMKHAVKRAKALIKDHSNLFIEPSSAVIEAIIATSMGDIRNAMNQFYLSSLKGGGNISIIVNKNENIGVKRKKRGNNTVAKIKFMEKDETLGLFHGLGRVLNPKWKEWGDSKRLNCDVEKLIDEFSTHPAIIMSFLFENYQKYFGDLNDATKAAEILSFSVKFLDNFVDRHEILLYGLWVSVLGLMNFNKHKVFKWTQITAPVRIERKKHVDNINLIGFKSSDVFYYNLIRNSMKNDLPSSKIVENDYKSDEMTIIDDDY